MGMFSSKAILSIRLLIKLNMLRLIVYNDCSNSHLEFKIVYVGCAEGPEHDQVLESVMVGPVPVGLSKFVLEAPAPKIDLIPQSDLVGLTVMLLSCSYREREFIRVGYYVNNDYSDEQLRENPPEQPDLQKIQRHILAEKPRVTRFPIPWDNDEAIPLPTAAEQAMAEEEANLPDEPEVEDEAEMDDEADMEDSKMEMDTDLNEAMTIEV
ncbi:Histone chaperone asf1 [Globomyces sp. JEL0801]|nr:Histone chaperone asf1 [Globomyces sp. JEL0801]